MTIYQFLPAASANYSFNPTLDGNVFNCVVTFNLAREDYYINIYKLTGELVVSKPLISSDNLCPINLIDGYFTRSKMTYRGAIRQFEVLP